MPERTAALETLYKARREAMRLLRQSLLPRAVQSGSKSRATGLSFVPAHAPYQRTRPCARRVRKRASRPRRSRLSASRAPCSHTALRCFQQSAAHPCPCVPAPLAPARCATRPQLRKLSSPATHIVQSDRSLRIPPLATPSRSPPMSALPVSTTPDLHVAVCK